jgi:hypothetical protein
MGLFRSASLSYATLRELYSLRDSLAATIEESRQLHADPHNIYTILRDLSIRMKTYEDPSMEVMGSFSFYGDGGRVITINNALDVETLPVTPIGHEIGHKEPPLVMPGEVIERRGACSGRIDTAAERNAWMRGSCYVISGDFARRVATRELRVPDVAALHHVPSALVRLRVSVGVLGGEWGGDLVQAARRLDESLRDLEWLVELQRQRVALLRKPA